jgi:sortase A
MASHAIQKAALALALMGVLQLLQAGWIPAKAALAQILIARAWQKGVPSKPWPWADTFPVARLQVPALGVDQYVLAGGQGNALAFGPSRSAGSGQLQVISGHRDTHFGFLQDLQSGHEITLTDLDGKVQRFRVSRSEIVDSRDQLPPPWHRGLVLLTCYPFDAVRAGGPLRFLVHAQT